MVAVRSKVFKASLVSLVVLSTIGLVGFRKTGISDEDVSPELGIPEQYSRIEGMCGTGHTWDFEYGYYSYEIPKSPEEVLADVSGNLKQQGFSAARAYSFAAFERRESNGTGVSVYLTQDLERELTVLSVQYEYPSVTWFGRPLPEFLK